VRSELTETACRMDCHSALGLREHLDLFMHFVEMNLEIKLINKFDK